VSHLPRRIVCAALQLKDGRVICGVRHFDQLMRPVLEGLYPDDPRRGVAECEQGFVDNDYLFLDRNEAWKVAEAAGQIQGTPPVPGMLFSEDLY
jgi:hypothetical protein